MRAYTRRVVSRGLDGLEVVGGHHLAGDEPLILAANHVCWWDGAVSLLASTAHDRDPRFLARASTMRDLPFLAAFGGVPLARGPWWEVRRSLRAAAVHLQQPRSVLWIYPQGDQRPDHLRPLGFRRGLSVLAALSGARVAPVSLAYRFRDGNRPAALMAFGAPLAAHTPDLVAVCEREVVRGLERLETGETGRSLLALRAALPRGSTALATLWRWLGGPVG